MEVNLALLKLCSQFFLVELNVIVFFLLYWFHFRFRRFFFCVDSRSLSTVERESVSRSFCDFDFSEMVGVKLLDHFLFCN